MFEPDYLSCKYFVIALWHVLMSTLVCLSSFVVLTSIYIQYYNLKPSSQCQTKFAMLNQVRNVKRVHWIYYFAWCYSQEQRENDWGGGAHRSQEKQHQKCQRRSDHNVDVANESLPSCFCAYSKTLPINNPYYSLMKSWLTPSHLM